MLGEVTLTDSAVILLFAGMLGAGARLSLMMTSLLPLLNGLCIVPMAIVAARSGGSRRLTLGACLLAGAAYFAAAAAPWFGRAAAAVLLTAIFCFALFMAGFVAGWFPLIDSFLEPSRRIAFFGRLRLCHQMAGVAFLFGVGLLIGRNPDAWTMQTVLFVSAFIFLGRAGFIARIPVFPERNGGGATGMRRGLAGAMANQPLIGFGRYVFALNLAAYGTVPLALLELKNQLHAPDNAVVTVSATALAGMLLGYALTAKAVRLLTVPGLFQCAHLVFALIALTLFCIGRGGVSVYILIAVLLLIHSFFVAATSVVSSSEMLALADVDNKVVDMALFGMFFYGGMGVSRLAASLFMGAKTATACWHAGGFAVCRYQFVFLLSAMFVALAAGVFQVAHVSGVPTGMPYSNAKAETG
jgi:hypothetical protein